MDITAPGLDKVKLWTALAKETLFDIHRQSFDVVFIAVPSKGMSRTLFANKLGPSPLRSKSFPYGYPWLSQHTKRVNDAVTIEAAFLFALALATLTQNNTAQVLFAAEERGKTFYGEPCSWWQTEEVRIMSELGATRSALYSCELVQKWTKQSRDKPGSIGLMTNFDAHCAERHEGWPQLSETALSYVGPFPDECKCGCKHTSLETARTQATAVEPSICAHLLQSLPRLPEERESLNMNRLRVNSAGHFSPLSDPDSPGIYLFRQQPWLQACWRALARVRGINQTQAKQINWLRQFLSKLAREKKKVEGKKRFDWQVDQFLYIVTQNSQISEIWSNSSARKVRKSPPVSARNVWNSPSCLAWDEPCRAAEVQTNTLPHQ